MVRDPSDRFLAWVAAGELSWMRTIRRIGQERLCGRVAGCGVTAAMSFARGQGLSRAAALAFYALLSVIPLLYFCLLALGYVGGGLWPAQLALRRELGALAPYFNVALFHRIQVLVWRSSAVTLMTAAFMLWTAGLFFKALADCLAVSCGSRLRRLGTTVLLMAAFVAAVSALHAPRLFFPAALTATTMAAWRLSCLSALFFAIYAACGRTCEARAATALVSLAVAVSAWLLAWLFSGVVALLPHYRLVFGNLTGVVLFLLWVHANAALVLLGGEFLRAWRDVEDDGCVCWKEKV